MEYKGLPARIDFSAIPAYYINLIMPYVNDMAELKLSLHLFRLLYRKNTRPQYVSFEELLGDPAVVESMKDAGDTVNKQIEAALSKAADRGIFLMLEVDVQGKRERIIFVNDPDNRQAVESIKNGTLKLSCNNIQVSPVQASEQLPEVFSYYEENIGLLTPLIVDEIRLAEQTYPKQWIIEAIKEAALNNKRSWRYISRILERWLSEGKTHGAHRQDYQQEDPSKYTRGKYQRFVQH